MLGLLYVKENPYSVKAVAANSADNTKHHGQLFVRGDHLVFQGLDAQLSMPLNGLKLERNRVLGGKLKFTHRMCPDWIFYTYNLRIVRDPAFINDYSLTEKVRQTRVYFHRLRRLLKWTCTAVLAVLLLSQSARDLLTEKAVHLVPVEKETAIGEYVFKGVSANERFIRDPAALKDINLIADRLLENMPEADRRFKFKIHIAASPEINAYAVPGGNIVINSGLILAVESSEEIAGVLAHEMSHVTHRHTMGHLAQNAGLSFLLMAILNQDLEWREDLHLLISRKFSRDCESQADHTGFMYLQRANIDPAGFTRFFERLDKNNSLFYTPADMFLRTHPTSRERYNALKSLSTENPPRSPYRPLGIDLAELQALIRRLRI